MTGGSPTDGSDLPKCITELLAAWDIASVLEDIQPEQWLMSREISPFTGEGTAALFLRLPQGPRGCSICDLPEDMDEDSFRIHLKAAVAWWNGAPQKTRTALVEASEIRSQAAQLLAFFQGLFLGEGCYGLVLARNLVDERNEG